MASLIYRNEQHSTLHGTSRLLDYKNCFVDWRETREYVNILHMRMFHAIGNGAQVYICMVVVRPSYLVLVAYRYSPAAECSGGQ